MLIKLKVLLAVAFAALAGLPAIAADLGKPAPVAAVAPAAVPDMWTSCYFEGGGAARFINKDSKAGVGQAGAGCTYHSLGNPFVGGVFGRYGFSVDGKDDTALLSFDQPVTLGARAGYLVMPSTLVYGLAGYSLGKGDDRGFIAGAGVEAPVLGNLRFAFEYQAEFAASREVVHQVGLYARLPF